MEIVCRFDEEPLAVFDLNCRDQVISNRYKVIYQYYVYFEIFTVVKYLYWLNMGESEINRKN